MGNHWGIWIFQKIRVQIPPPQASQNDIQIPHQRSSFGDQMPPPTLLGKCKSDCSFKHVAF